jgi:capsid portal protein
MYTRNLKTYLLIHFSVPSGDVRSHTFKDVMADNFTIVDLIFIPQLNTITKQEINTKRCSTMDEQINQ